MRITSIIILCCIFISCGKVSHNSINQVSPLPKKEFDIKLMLNAVEGEFDVGGKYNHFIGYEHEVYFTPGDTPIIRIPCWDLKVYEDSIQFIKVECIKQQNTAYTIDKSLDIFHVRVTKTGRACDDTDEHKVEIDSPLNHSVLESLEEVMIFKNCIGTRRELYIVSYHQCVMPATRIYRIRV